MDKPTRFYINVQNHKTMNLQEVQGLFGKVPTTQATEQNNWIVPVIVIGVVGYLMYWMYNDSKKLEREMRVSGH
jgi:hypothetical protein